MPHQMTRDSAAVRALGFENVRLRLPDRESSPQTVLRRPRAIPPILAVQHEPHVAAACGDRGCPALRRVAVPRRPPAMEPQPEEAADPEDEEKEKQDERQDARTVDDVAHATQFTTARFPRARGREALRHAAAHMVPCRRPRQFARIPAARLFWPDAGRGSTLWGS